MDCGVLEGGWLIAQEGAPKKPTDVANAIVDALPASSMIAERPTLAGPGFINVKLNHGWVAEQIHSMLIQARLPLLLISRMLAAVLSLPCNDKYSRCPAGQSFALYKQDASTMLHAASC